MLVFTDDSLLATWRCLQAGHSSFLPGRASCAELSCLCITLAVSVLHLCPKLDSRRLTGTLRAGSSTLRVQDPLAFTKQSAQLTISPLRTYVFGSFVMWGFTDNMVWLLLSWVASLNVRIFHCKKDEYHCNNRHNAPFTKEHPFYLICDNRPERVFF